MAAPVTATSPLRTKRKRGDMTRRRPGKTARAANLTTK